MSEGGQLLLLEAEPDPGLALLIPGDNYSSAIVRGVPGGLAEVGTTVVNTTFPLSMQSSLCDAIPTRAGNGTSQNKEKAQVGAFSEHCERRNFVDSPIKSLHC